MTNGMDPEDCNFYKPGPKDIPGRCWRKFCMDGTYGECDGLGCITFQIYLMLKLQPNVEIKF